jgi:cyclophilin family peptidyl-prolyl cis-trans isomerase
MHRVVRDFCIQTGDPTASGYGGESAWGGTFEDEFPEAGHRFDRSGMVGMANSGKNTNASQFFITTVATPHLDRNHTCWGEVVDGMDNVKRIELVPVDDYKHPLTEIKLVNITFSYRCSAQFCEFAQKLHNMVGSVDAVMNHFWLVNRRIGQR